MYVTHRSACTPRHAIETRTSFLPFPSLPFPSPPFPSLPFPPARLPACLLNHPYPSLSSHHGGTTYAVATSVRAEVSSHNSSSAIFTCAALPPVTICSNNGTTAYAGFVPAVHRCVCTVRTACVAGARNVVSMVQGKKGERVRKQFLGFVARAPRRARVCLMRWAHVHFKNIPFNAGSIWRVSSTHLLYST